MKIAVPIRMPDQPDSAGSCSCHSRIWVFSSKWGGLWSYWV